VDVCSFKLFKFKKSMKILFHLGHPAHFHLFKNVIPALKINGHHILIIIKKKDILEDLLKNAGFDYVNILPDGRKNSKFGIALGLLKQDGGILKYAIQEKPDLMIGTSVPIAHVGKLLGIPTINVNEDDADAVPLHSKLAYPLISNVVSPIVCDNSKWEHKSIKYPGYHELAYLHPNHFTPDIDICKKYMDVSKPYFVIRFSGLDAHHDKGVGGINDHLAKEVISLLEPYGNVFITSERSLSSDLESYRKAINSLDIHHVLAFAKLYIGDSQTMAAESGVLGTPFIRFNDFVGRIGYLNELENIYHLGYGFKSNQKDEMMTKLVELLAIKDLDALFEERRAKMLKDKIDVSQFLIWFIENYPESIKVMQQTPNFINKFK
jgi:predicted glycosyltransferase